MKNSKLKDHKPDKENKKVHNPPFINTFGQAPTDPEWRKILIPESLWVDDIINHQNLPDPRWFCYQIASILKECIGEATVYPLGLISEFCVAIEKNEALLRQKLSDKGLDKVFSARFKSILALYKLCPLNDFLGETKSNLDTGFKESISALQNRYSDESKKIDSVYLYIQLEMGKIKFNAQNLKGTIDALKVYPLGTEEETERAESFMRITKNFVSVTVKEKGWEIIKIDEKQSMNWSAYFWRSNAVLDPCEVDYKFENLLILHEDLCSNLDQIYNLNTKIWDLFFELYHKLPMDLFEPDFFDVTNGLIARQTNLTVSILGNPVLWRVDHGQITLRAMMDSLINMIWMIENEDKEIYSKYKVYGSGKQKLLMLHLENLIAKSPSDSLKSYIKGIRDKINDEMFEEFIPINVGNWNGQDIRKNAIDVGMKDFYNQKYSPASAQVHGDWSALKEANLFKCQNPLHLEHWLPNFAVRPTLDPGIPLLALEIWKASIDSWLSAYDEDVPKNDFISLSNDLRRIVSNLIETQKRRTTKINKRKDMLQYC